MLMTTRSHVMPTPIASMAMDVSESVPRGTRMSARAQKRAMLARKGWGGQLGTGREGWNRDGEETEREREGTERERRGDGEGTERERRGHGEVTERSRRGHGDESRGTECRTRQDEREDGEI